MRTRTTAFCAALVALLAACASDAGEPTSAVPADVPTAKSQAVAGTAVASEPSDLDDVIVQYDVFGGLMAPGPGTRLPRWTLYGDGMLVWTDDGPPTPGFAAQVWTGHPTEEEVASLLAYADEVGFWGLDAAYGPEPILSETTAEPGGIVSIRPNPVASLDQPTSVLAVAAGDKRHQVTIYPADWDGAPEAYHLMRERLLETHPADAAPFVPTSFTLHAKTVPDDTVGGLPVSEWPFADTDLADVVAAPLPLGSDPGVTVGDFIATNGQFVSQDGIIYKVELLAAAPRVP